MEHIFAFDEAVILFCQDVLRNPVTDPIMGLFSFIGSAGIIWFVIAAILMIRKKTRRAGLDMLICMAVCWAISEIIIKPLVMRERPFLTVEGLNVLYERFADAGSYSFPSSHACSSFAAAYAIYRGCKRGWLAYIPAVMISLSRMYVGVHFPTDVLCGALLGTLGSIGVYALLRRFNPLPRKTPPESPRKK